MPTETETHGALVITRDRPASTLSAHEKAIFKVLKKALPADVAEFFASCDGMTYAVSRGRKSLGLGATLCGLERLFDGFKRHRQYKSEEAYEDAVCEGKIYDAPFCGEIWSEDFEVSESADLVRLNKLVRSKLLVSVEGAPDALVIDFAPKPKNGVAREYEIALAHEGNDYCPLDLSFGEFITNFERFGGSGWYYAYSSRKGAKTLNIDLAETVTRALAPFAAAFPAEVQALIDRARATASRRASGA